MLKYYRLFRFKYGVQDKLKDLHHNPKDHHLKSILSKLDLSVVNEKDETNISFSNSDDSSHSSSSTSSSSSSEEHDDIKNEKGSSSIPLLIIEEEKESVNSNKQSSTSIVNSESLTELVERADSGIYVG